MFDRDEFFSFLHLLTLFARDDLELWAVVPAHCPNSLQSDFYSDSAKPQVNFRRLFTQSKIEKLRTSFLRSDFFFFFFSFFRRGESVGTRRLLFNASISPNNHSTKLSVFDFGRKTFSSSIISRFGFRFVSSNRI